MNMFQFKRIKIGFFMKYLIKLTQYISEASMIPSTFVLKNGNICLDFFRFVIDLNFVVGRKYFILKTVSKVILFQFINTTVMKDVIHGFNLVKIGHFKSK